MTYIVTKPFATLNRRFRVGDEIAATDIEGALTADDWADLGCLESVPERVVEYPNASRPVFDPRDPLN